MTVARSTPRYRPVNWFASGNGEPLLLLNGWTASGLVWPGKFLAQLERRHRVIRIDARGTGFSRAAAAPFTIADLADDAHEILSELNATPAMVLGMSMGGMVAQELAIRHPGDVRRLILVGTSPPTPAALRADDEITWHMFRRRRPGEAYGGFLRDLWARAAAPGWSVRSPELLDELVEQLAARPTRRSGALAQARAAGCWRGPGRLARITAPTVVVHGREDRLRPVGNGMRLARLIRGARYLELPGVGHLVPLEAMDELLALVEED
jgi:3-oxoadipate enol-lactonase